MARRLWRLLALGAVMCGSLRVAHAQAPQASPPQLPGAPAPARDRWSLGVGGGLSVASLMGEVGVRAPFGLVLGAGAGGTRFGPSVAGHVAYDLALGDRWSLRPGVRVKRHWMASNDDSCAFSRCIYDFAVVEIAAHVRLGAGFTLDLGVPLAGIIPTSPEAGDKRARLSFETLATTPELLIVSTVMLGWTFDL